VVAAAVTVELTAVVGGDVVLFVSVFVDEHLEVVEFAHH
jgi:hypothetical protein